ncbi:PMEI domain-containing protein [Heracleum sosnowskyi]|uniref:PMEI domain-containing protein n=1 Tax=Heracleum sosnowskyi TaxID=360622 RepID=A0AAD8LY85_9APIA|nr:PMEI domain-containing protein [Heracleum sosnowskyi]
MAILTPLTLSLLLFISLSTTLLHNTAAKSSHSDMPSSDLIHASCIHANYPQICLRTLSTYAPPATTPNDVAQAAVKISLTRSQKASEFLANLKNKSTKREKDAHLRRGSEFKWEMSNVETWVSAALTNEDTCLDGFKEIDGKVRSDVRRKITNVARVTSNALYLINLMDSQAHRSFVLNP